RAHVRDVGCVDSAGLDVVAEKARQVENAVAEGTKLLKSFGPRRAKRFIEKEGEGPVERALASGVGPSELGEKRHQVARGLLGRVELPGPHGFADDFVEEPPNAPLQRDVAHDDRSCFLPRQGVTACAKPRSGNPGAGPLTKGYDATGARTKLACC